MYKAIVRRKILKQWDRLNRADFDLILSETPDHFEHTFSGDNALGGTRHTKDGFRRWFQRLHRIFPEHRMEVRDIGVLGWPWDTTVLVEWHNDAEPADGVPYKNDGVHVIRLRWGKPTHVHGYLDTEKVTEVCDRLAAAGMAEAAAPPVAD